MARRHVWKNCVHAPQWVLGHCFHAVNNRWHGGGHAEALQPIILSMQPQCSQ